MKIIYNTLFSKNILHFTLNLESCLQLYRCNSMVVLGGAHTEFCVCVRFGFPESHTLHSERLGRFFFFSPLILHLWEVVLLLFAHEAYLHGPGLLSSALCIPEMDPPIPVLWGHSDGAGRVSAWFIYVFLPVTPNCRIIFSVLEI